MTGRWVAATVVGLLVGPAAGAASLAAQAEPLPPVSFEAATDIPTGRNPSSVGAGDFFRDGDSDLFVTHSGFHTVRMLRGDGTGAFQAIPDRATAPGPWNVAVGDVNLDGFPDTVTTSFRTATAVLRLGNGNGFDPPVPLQIGFENWYAAIGNLTDDDAPDVAVTMPALGQVAVLLGDGTGAFPTRVTLQLEPVVSPFGVAIGDVDGDGVGDLAVVNQHSFGVSVLRSDGTGGFAPPVDFPLADVYHPFDLRLTDLDLDGDLDLAVAVTDGPVNVLRNDGSGGFGPAQETPSGSAGFAVAAGDVNFDGIPDLAATDPVANLVRILLGDGTGQFENALEMPAGERPAGLALADFNRDGSPDLAAANLDDDTVSVWLNTTVVVDAVSPLEGPAAGGTRVRIRGSGLTGATGVAFGDRLGTGFTSTGNGTGIEVVSPAATDGGPVPLTIRFPSREVRVATFTYQTRPVVPSDPAVIPLTGWPGGLIILMVVAAAAGIAIGLGLVYIASRNPSLRHGPRKPREPHPSRGG